jgi:hypothetical protein
MWKEMFEIRTNGRTEAASRLANMVMQRRQLEKRDTIAEFWARRLHDMQLRDDPVERAAAAAANAAAPNPGAQQGRAGGQQQPPASQPQRQKNKVIWGTNIVM